MARQWRDSAAIAPENTIESFSGAFAAGADFIEFDVVPAKDGLIVTHSAQLADHVFPAPAAAVYTAQLTLDELALLTVGHRGGAHDRMPTLAAVLECVTPHMTGERFLNIEVKGLGGTGQAFSPAAQRGFVSLILQTVQGAGLLERVLFSSFQPSTVRLLRELHPRARVGQLFTARPEAGYIAYTTGNVAITLDTLPGAALHPPLQCFMEPGAPDLPEAAEVSLWALREEPVASFLPYWQSAIARLASARRLNIITDYPAELRAALKL